MIEEIFYRSAYYNNNSVTESSVTILMNINI